MRNLTKMKINASKLLMLILVVGFSANLLGQVAINTDGSNPDGSAMLDVSSDTAGILIPRITTSSMNNITNPATGLMIYNTSDSAFYFYNGLLWKNVNEAVSDNDWTVNGSNMYSTESGSLSIGTSAPLGKLHIHDGLNSTAKVYITPKTFSSGDNSILFFAEDNNATFGMYWKYDGANNQMQLFGKSNFIFYGPHISVNRSSGNVGIGTSTIAASAALEVESSSKGFLPPRMSATQMNAIATPVEGLMVYNTSIKSTCFYDGTRWNKSYNNDGKSCGTISYGGQTYQTVIIGTQCWMAENLNIGVTIIGGNNQINNGTIEKYCYDDNTSNCNTYGGLYQWDEMMQYVTTAGTQGICPTGWHLPTDDEWKTMEMYLGMSQSEANGTGWRGTDEGGKMKETGTTHWNGTNTGATNSSSFTGLPGGYRGTNGTFLSLTNYAYFWSSSNYGLGAWHRGLGFYSAQVDRNGDGQAYGFSVRCVRD